MGKIINAIFISDIHAGCQLGLCPPRVKLDSGGSYHHSDLQKKVWAMWKHFNNKWIPMVTKGEPFVLVMNGDAIDGIHHGSKTQISHNITDQKNIAYEILAPLVERAEKYFHVRGTEAHVGKSAEHEESLAQMLGAVKDEIGNYARWDLWLNMNKILIHATHHVGTTSSAAYESTAVYKELVEAYNEAGRWREKPPDVVIRSHRHRAFEIKVPAIHGSAMAIVTPGWQLKTPFVYRLASGRAATPQIGGFIVRCGDEDTVYARSKIWKVERSPEVFI